MTETSPKFSITDYELYGYTNPFLSEIQASSVQQVEVRVDNQLNWLAQLLGWSGNEYWSGLVSNIDQKRQLLGGTFGVYNSYVFPAVRELRDWEDVIVIEADDRIQVGQSLVLGEFTYGIENIKKDGQNTTLSIGKLNDQFLLDYSLGSQLKISLEGARPSPFYRPTPGISADASFLVALVEDTNSIVLYPNFDNQFTLPYLFNTFYVGSTLYFDKPVQLIISGETSIDPSYDFDSKSWHLSIPSDLKLDGSGINVLLKLGDYHTPFLILPWSFSSDWNCKSVLDNFTGVWGNKGGFLPFNFVFDSLSLHGFDEEKSLYLAPFERKIPFNDALNFIYYQKAAINQIHPSPKQNQIWWNNRTGTFSVYGGGSFNCGPWIDIDYPNDWVTPIVPDLLFPNYNSFSDYASPIAVGAVVRILNAAGLSKNDEVIGLTGTIGGTCQVEMFKTAEDGYWQLQTVQYQDELNFSIDAPILPAKVIIKLGDSSYLRTSTSRYTVANLLVDLVDMGGPYPVNLSRWDNQPRSPWYISPPSQLKYIGNTRLFGDGPQDGELSWDYGNPNPATRGASIFYYNRWELVGSQWELQGDWIGINSQTPSTPPSTVNFGVIKIFCDGTLLEPAVPHQTENYQISYTTNNLDGTFDFSFSPMTFDGMVKLPVIEITDSLTHTFRHIVSDLVFSGLQIYMSPNVRDSSTSLRVWKTKSLYTVNSPSELDLYDNAFVADRNSGAGDDNWESYFLRLPPAYQRNGPEWQKINLVCQNFGLWGSPVSPEDMKCPPQQEEPRTYDDVFLYGGDPSGSVYLYSEPYLYSNVKYGLGLEDDYLNATILPGVDEDFDDFSGAKVVEYSPLHDRRVTTDPPLDKVFGDWEGEYYRAEECRSLSGHLVNDLKDSTIEKINAPLWDSSIYKIPTTSVIDEQTFKVDANHYKVGYAYFAADLSAAGETFFDPFNPASWKKCTQGTSLYLTPCPSCQ
jgi:hypothetical protein